MTLPKSRNYDSIQCEKDRVQCDLSFKLCILSLCRLYGGVMTPPYDGAGSFNYCGAMIEPEKARTFVFGFYCTAVKRVI